MQVPECEKEGLQGNVAPCCQVCNAAKSDKTLAEFNEWASTLKINFTIDQLNELEKQYEDCSNQ